MAYAIDNLTNGKGTYAETIINGGTIKSSYVGIRQFLNGVEADNILVVNGGTVTGNNTSIFFQDPSANCNSGKLVVGENATLGNRIYVSGTAGTPWDVELSVSAQALGAYGITTDEIPETTVIKEVNGVYGFVNAVASVNGIGYESFAEALDAAADGAVITLVNDVEYDAVLTFMKNIQIDLNGYTLKAAGVAVFANGGSIVDNGETKGLLEVPKGYLIMNHAQYPMLPVWNETNGYVFVKVKDQYTFVEDLSTENKIVIDFLPGFDTNNHRALFANGAADNGITIKFNIVCYDDGKAVETIGFTVSEETISGAYGQAGGAIRYVVNGAGAGFDSYGIQVVLESDTGLSYVTEYGQFSNGIFTHNNENKTTEATTVNG